MARASPALPWYQGRVVATFEIKGRRLLYAWRLALADFLAWIIAIPLAVVLRFDFSLPQEFQIATVVFGVAAALAYVGLASAFRMYSGRYVSGTFDEVVGVAILTGFITLFGTLTLFARPGTLPRSTFIIAGGLAGFAILAVRFVLRRSRSLRSLSREGNRTLIYGAGDAGSQLATLMQADRSSRFVPVGFVDDDPNKRHLRRANLRVLGTGDSLGTLLSEYGVETVVVAIAGVSSERLREIDRVCGPADIRVQVIPTASEIVGGAIRLGDVSDLSEEEIMGRRVIHTDEHQISEFLSGKTILITGAGGSIGSELARQVHRYRPQRVVLLDRDESALHETQLSIDGSGLLVSDDLLLCDIRDQQRLTEAFVSIQPDVVFHAAALKHLTFLERFPSEAWKTNVLGTRNVANAAAEANVGNFINISTDKAADPSSVLGQSKRITERLVSHRGSSNPGWVSVRFGNVLGSRGSVVTTFRYQISQGGPVTVTDREVSRYFMTIREAVHLVLQASVLGRDGETLILDMGEPVRIAAIAEFMVARSGREIPIVFTGLRDGEKVNEVLVGEQETISSPLHPLISHTQVPPLSDSLDLLPKDDLEAKRLVEETARA